MKKVMIIVILLTVSNSTGHHKSVADLPNRSIERSNSPNVPFGANPAPQSGISVGSVSAVIFDKDEDQCRHAWDAVAKTKVRNLHLAQSCRIVLSIKCKIDIHRHSQCPEGISRHKSVRR